MISLKMHPCVYSCPKDCVVGVCIAPLIYQVSTSRRLTFHLSWWKAFYRWVVYVLNFLDCSLYVAVAMEGNFNGLYCDIR